MPGFSSVVELRFTSDFSIPVAVALEHPRSRPSGIFGGLELLSIFPTINFNYVEIIQYTYYQ